MTDNVHLVVSAIREGFYKSKWLTGSLKTITSLTVEANYCILKQKTFTKIIQI